MKEYSDQPIPALDLRRVFESGGFTIQQPHSDTFSREVSNTGFEELPDEIRVRYFDTLVGACRNYYSGYIFKDPFGLDEGKRLAWQTGMLQQYKEGRKHEALQEFQRRNKLRLGVIQGLQGAFNGLVGALNNLDIHTEEAEAVRALVKKWPQIDNIAPPDPAIVEKLRALDRVVLKEHGVSDRYNWKTITFDEKLEVVHKIDTIASAFLTLVTVRAPETKKTPLDNE